jgi:hypothetical protein
VKYANDLVLLAKEETVLQGKRDRVTEIGRFYRVEMNMAKNKVMRISKETSPLRITIDKKQLENVKYFSYLGSMVIKDARHTCELNLGLPRQKLRSAEGRLSSPANWTSA